MAHSQDISRVESLAYHSTMVESDVITRMCHGSFSRSGAQEVVRARTDGIELCRFDATYQCLVVVSRLPLFATVQSIITVPYPSVSGGTSAFADALAVASDSGTVTLLRYVVPVAPVLGMNSHKDAEGEWEVMDRVVIGRSGVRVSSAGCYLAVDTRSRALLVAAPMKQKLIIPLREGEGDHRGCIKFQSGLDASRPCVMYDCCAVDVAADQNTQFAVLESELSSDSTDAFAGGPPEKYLSFYEFSASLNTVTRVLSFKVASTAHALIAVPGDSGPGGVLVCTDTELVWESVASRSIASQQSIAPPPIKVEIPRRSDLSFQSQDPMIVAHAITRLPKRFFLLMQNELGDVFRVEVNTAPIQQHFRMKRAGPTAPGDAPLVVRYFDTLPPATSMILFKKGYLFCASEVAAHGFYRVIGDGTTSQTIIKRVRMPTAPAPAPQKAAGSSKAMLAAPSRYVTLFHRHFNAETKLPELRNVTLLQSLANSNESVAIHASLDPQQRLRFIRLGGRNGQHSQLQTVRFGLSTSHIRSIELPLNPEVVIPLLEPSSLLPNPGMEDESAGAACHNRILLSSAKGSYVVHLGDEITADNNCGIITGVQTIAAATIAEGHGYIQIHAGGVAILRPDSPVMWAHPQQKAITAADCSNTQIVAGFDNGGLMAFDLGFTGQQFSVMSTQPTFSNVKFVSLPRKAPIHFCAVATAASKVFVLDMKTLREADTITLPIEVSSILLTTLDSSNRLFLFVGLIDGRLIRAEIDPVTGKRLSTSAYQCGITPARLSRGDATSYCVVASSEVWRCYMLDGAFRISPIIVNQATVSPNSIFAAAHRKGLRFDLLLSVTGRTISFSSVNLDERSASLYSVSTCAMGTVGGRKMVAHPTRPNIMAVVCMEYRGYNPNDVQSLYSDNKELPPQVAMAERSPNRVSKHVSCVHLFDSAQNIVSPPLYLNEGDSALSMHVGSLPEFGKEPVLVLGCASLYDHGHGRQPPSWGETCLRTYRFALPALSGPDGVLGTHATAMPKLELVHATILTHGDLPSAVHVCSQGGFVLVGFGPKQGLHQYGWGLKHLLWKRKLLETFVSRIVTIDTIQDTTTGAMLTAAGYAPLQAMNSATTLILCGLQDQSVMIARLVRCGGAQALLAVAIDPFTRFVAASCFLDDRTVAVSDKFGSLVVLRIPASLRLDLPEPIDGMSDEELIAATTFRREQPLQLVNSFHVGQTITSLQAVVRPRVAGVTNVPTTVLVYATSHGKIGALVPFPSEEDAALGAYLDPILAEYFRSPVERPLLPHRSRMTPKHNVIDGDSVQLISQSKQIFLSTEAKIAVEQRLQKFCNVEATHRKLLDLPERKLPSVHDLCVKMKALLGLSE
jgi:splicing factor 3B subunit 3